MSDREDEQDKIRKLLKSQPLMTPPDSFYEGVRRRIESKKTAARGFWVGVPLKVFASACVVMLIVWVTKEKQPIPREFSSPAPQRQSEAVQNQPVKKSADAASLSEAGREPALKDMKLNPVEEQKVSRMVQSAPTSAPLSKRADVHMQARDMNGAAAQNSFDYTDQLQGKQKGELASAPERDASPALKSKTIGGAGALAASAPTARLYFNSGWLKCTQNAECTLVPEPGECQCACKLAINRKFESDYQKLYTGFCRENPSDKPCNKRCPDTRPVCAAGTCDALIKN